MSAYSLPNTVRGIRGYSSENKLYISALIELGACHLSRNIDIKQIIIQMFIKYDKGNL